MSPHLSRTRHTSWLGYVSLSAFLVLLCVAPAQADSAESTQDRVGAAEYYAGLLAEEPEGEAVVVDDSLAGLYDLEELEGDLHEAFGPLEVPYYVVASALPGHSTMPKDFLAATQDRVGEPGLYVYLRPGIGEVTALSREVDLPVDRANSVLLREGGNSSFLPLDERAELFARTLVAPDLDERYEKRWGPGRQLLGPVYWWADTYLRQLSLQNYNGPERLGTTVAFAAGLTLTLAVAMGWVRSGRRKRATEAGHTGRPSGDRALLTGMTLATATGTVIMIASLVHLNNATLPQDVEKVAPLPPVTPPYVVDTVRLERVARELREDPFYVDPQTEMDTQGLTEVVERDLPEDRPVYVMVMPMNPHDESGGDGEIFAHALHHVMGQDGFFVTVHGRSGSAIQVDVARFGLTYEDGDRDWSHLGDVTGYLTDITPERALSELFDVVETEMVVAPGEVSEVPYSVEYRAEPSPERSRFSRFFSEDFYLALFLVGPLTAAALLALVRAVGAGVVRMRVAPGRALRSRAVRAVRRMTKALQEAPADHPGRSEALRESDTALTVLAGRPDELDLVGVTVLADRVTLRLDPDPETAARADEPVCMVDPLHGPSVLRKVVRKKNGHREVVIPAPVCAACAVLSKAQRRSRTLRVAAPEGGRVPHSEPDRAWVRSGYGAEYRLDVEELLKESDVH